MEVVEVLVREVESFDEGAMALFAFGKDEDVVSQDPGVDWPGSEHVDPRFEEGGDEEHAEEGSPVGFHRGACAACQYAHPSCCGR